MCKYKILNSKERHKSDLNCELRGLSHRVLVISEDRLIYWIQDHIKYDTLYKNAPLIGFYEREREGDGESNIIISSFDSYYDFTCNCTSYTLLKLGKLQDENGVFMAPGIKVKRYSLYIQYQIKNLTV